jgi:hypothetical protein
MTALGPEPIGLVSSASATASSSPETWYIVRGLPDSYRLTLSPAPSDGSTCHPLSSPPPVPPVRLIFCSSGFFLGFP